MHSSSEIQLSNGLSVGISCIKLYRPHSLLPSLVAITVFKCNFGIFTSFDAKTWTKQIMANMWARNEGWWGVPKAQARQNWWVPLQNWWLETTSAIQIIAASAQIMPSAWLFGMWGVIHCTYLNHASSVFPSPNLEQSHIQSSSKMCGGVWWIRDCVSSGFTVGGWVALPRPHLERPHDGPVTGHTMGGTVLKWGGMGVYQINFHDITHHPPSLSNTRSIITTDQ